MKIAAYLKSDISKGGGFNQSLNDLYRLIRICKKNKIEIELYTIKKNLHVANELDIPIHIYNTKITDILKAYFNSTIVSFLINPLLNFLPNFEKKLKKNNIDLVYFLSPNILQLSLIKLNFITTIWDLGHKSVPYLKEMKNKSTNFMREWLYSNSLPNAYKIITDCSDTSNQIEKYYGVDSNKLLSIPFSINPFFKKNIVSKFSSKLPKKYYLYPAQFWTHKNHNLLIRAFKCFKNKNINLIFTGNDQGNLKYINESIKENNLSDKIINLGFVNNDILASLYKNCYAVIMPSLIGPTNIPPIEAWFFKKPILYPKQFKSFTKQGAIYFDYFSEEELAKSIQKIENKAYYKKKVNDGTKRLNEINKEIVLKTKKIEKFILEYQKIIALG